MAKTCIKKIIKPWSVAKELFSLQDNKISFRITHLCSNTLWCFSVVKNENFSLNLFSYFCSNYWLRVYVRTASFAWCIEKYSSCKVLMLQIATLFFITLLFSSKLSRFYLYNVCYSESKCLSKSIKNDLLKSNNLSVLYTRQSCFDVEVMMYLYRCNVNSLWIFQHFKNI